MGARKDGDALPIAVVGIGCRFPSAHGPDEFWRMLRDGTDAIGEVPRSRFDVAAHYAPEKAKPGKMSSRWGGFLDDVDAFDASFFGIAPREANRMDPQQRLLLETAWEALEDAGIVPAALAGSATGVFMGQLAADYGDLLRAAGELDIYSTIGAAARGVLAGRLSYALDLRGPSVVLDTACSSSLMAVHMACQSLRTGESRLALAGGVNLVLTPECGIAYSQASMLAADGRCKFGDASADGFVRSEGIGVVVLRPLADALADGDRIRAVVLGSATGNDGQGSGYLITPAVAGQESVLLRAYRAAGVDQSTVDYVEAHGTGTSVGDRVEIAALAAVLGRDRPADRPLLLGSVKTNIGHAEGAAGIAGFIKAVLCLEHHAVPENLHLRTPTPAIDWDATPLVLPRELTPLPDRGRPAVAGVSALGIAGTNVHVVLAGHTATRPPEAPERPSHLLSLSARDPDALVDLAADYVAYLKGIDGSRLADVCYSAGAHRATHEFRLAVTGTTAEDIAGTLASYTHDPGTADVVIGTDVADPPRVVFVFPGQGSQWTGMGREPLASSPVFADALHACDDAVRREAGWSVIDVLNAGDLGKAGLAVIQPALWAIEVALAALWRSWGIEPDVVVGHSMGEIAAAHVAGALDLTDAAAVICRRGALAETVGGGGMATVEMSEKDARIAILGCTDRVAIAATNSPTWTVLSGESRALDEIGERLSARGVFFRRIDVAFASHSPQVDPILPELTARLLDLRPKAGHIPIFSTVLGAAIDGSGMDAAYWARNLREKVRFTEAIDTLAARRNTAFVEVSPHPVLLGAVRDRLADIGSGLAVGSLRCGRPETRALLDSLAQLHAAGRPVDWRGLYGPQATFVRLPTYPWRRERYWLPDAPATSAPTHPLIGTVALGDVESGEAEWERDLDLAVNAYLTGHRVQGTALVPGTVAVEMAVAAAKQMFGDRRMLVRDLAFHSPLLIRPDVAQRLRLRLTRAGNDEWRLALTARPGPESTWTVWATACLAPRTDDETPPSLCDDEIRERCVTRLDGSAFYRAFARGGNEWGGSFQAVRDILRRDSEALAELEAPPDVAATLAEHEFHPALLDACAQALGAAMSVRPGEEDVFVLAGIDEAWVLRCPPARVRAHAMLLPDATGDSISGDIRVYDEHGEPVAAMLGVRLRYLLSDRRATAGRADWCYDIRWRPTEPPKQTGVPAGPWLLLADRTGVAHALADELRRTSRSVVLAVPGTGYGRVSADCYQLDPNRPDDVTRVLTEGLAGTGAQRWAGVVHLWNLNAPALDVATEPAVRNAEIEGCRSIVTLLRGIGAAPEPLVSRVWLVTRGAHAVLDTDRPAPLQAPAWGLGRTLAIEHPELACALIDLDPAGTAIGLLFAELAADDGERQVALRGAGRHVARLAPSARIPPGPAAVPLRADASYLITGGLGELGTLVAGWLIDNGARHLLLVGRSGPAPDRLRQWETWRAAGIRVEYAGCDVTDADRLGATVSGYENSGAPGIAGVVHAAGNVRYAPLVDTRAEDLADVLGPKITGAWALHRIFDDRRLDFLVLFSSAASVIGSPLLGVYAAGNAFLDALAGHRARGGLAGMSVNWGFWSGVGMAARREQETGRAATPVGTRAFTPAEGLAMLGRLMTGNAVRTVVLPTDWTAWRAAHPALASAPMFTELFSPTDIPPLPAPDGDDVEAVVMDRVAQVLHLPSRRISARKPLRALGLDSLTAVEVRDHLRRDCRVTIPVLALLGEHTVADVIAAVMAQRSK